MDYCTSTGPALAVVAGGEAMGKNRKKRAAVAMRVIKNRNTTAEVSRNSKPPKKILPRAWQPSGDEVASSSSAGNVAAVGQTPAAQQVEPKTKPPQTSNRSPTKSSATQLVAAPQPEQAQFLESEYIFPLKKRSARFVNAVYFCRLCEHHINTWVHASDHVKEKMHKRLKKERDLVDSLLLIPDPGRLHLDYLDRMLRQIAELHRLPAESEARLDNVQTCLTHLARSYVLAHQECFVRVYGSCLSGFALRDETNVNLELVFPESRIDHSAALVRITHAIYQSKGLLCDVAHDFGCKWPYVSFKFVHLFTFGTWRCVLSVNNSDAFSVAQFLRTLASAYPQLRDLAVVWRHWAKLCQLDNYQDGCLPAYAFDLMLVHYLQRSKPPLLPVIHSCDGGGSADEAKCQKFVHYERDVEKVAKMLSGSPWNFGEIFVGLLRYYALADDAQSLVVNVRQKEPLTREAKDWSCRRLAIEDPFIPSKNLARLSNEMYAYMMKCLQNAYRYFAIPQTRVGPAFQLVQGKVLVGGPFSVGEPFVGERLTGEQLLTRAVVAPVVKHSPTGSSETCDPQSHVVVEPEPVSTERRGLVSEHRPTGLTAAEESNDAASSEKWKRVKRKAVAKKESDDAKAPSSGPTEVSFETPRPYGCAEMVNLGRRCLPVRRVTAERLFSSPTLPYVILRASCKEAKRVRTHVAWLLGGAPPSADCAAANFSIITSVLKWPADHGLCMGAFEKNHLHGARDDCTVPKPFVPKDAAIGEHFASDLSSAASLSIGDAPQVRPKNGLLQKVVCEAEPGAALQLLGDVTCLDLQVKSESLAKGLFALSILNEQEPDCGDKILHETPDDAKVAKEPSPFCATRPSCSKPGNGKLCGAEVEKPRVPVSRQRQLPLLEAVAAASKLTADQLHFSFDSAYFLGSIKKPKSHCATCGLHGHLTRYCSDPEQALGPLKRLQPLTENYAAMQNYLITHVLRSYGISAQRIHFQEVFRCQLQTLLRQHLAPDCRLHLFGSSCNGYGFSASDLDLCLTFDSFDAVPQNLNYKAIIGKIASILTRDKSFRAVLPVTQAKVPIVRFYHCKIGLEGDISLYNILALRNTQLMFCYSSIDQRAKALGYMVKVFAKYMDVGDASKGSLSSYAYVVMMTHFLQRTKPPVLPNLQQMGTFKSCVVDGWETYFNADWRAVKSEWNGGNTESLSELWVGFLRYFTEQFQFRNDVVQIRRSVPPHVTKLEKSWTDKPLAIEDPFELSHNLAAGVSKKMFLYIVRVLRKARQVFGDGHFEFEVSRRLGCSTIPFDALQRYFFEVALKMDEQPPKDRVCRRCERVGHFAENCPTRKAVRNRASDDSPPESDNADFPPLINNG